MFEFNSTTKLRLIDFDQQIGLLTRKTKKTNMKATMVLLLHFLTVIETSSFLLGCSITERWTVHQKEARLQMAKDSSRARMERSLEDMMGDDWRVFRAKLVAQEQIEAASNVCEEQDSEQAQQEKLGVKFASLISSIFPQKEQDNSRMEKSCTENEISILNEGDNEKLCEDPFASEEEMIAVNNLEPKIRINYHRWAHFIPHIEPGCVLLANERFGGVFHQTVVLITNHNELKGTTGIVINRPLPGNVFTIASENSNVDLSFKIIFNKTTVSYGGPVMKETYSILHGYGEVEDSKKVAHGVFVGGSRELMNEARKKNFDPSQALVVKGRVEWFPGQLSREVSKGVWYVASASPDFILRYAGAPQSEEDNLTLICGQIYLLVWGVSLDKSRSNMPAKVIRE